MADLTHPIPDEDALTAQMVAREIASQEDAAVQAPLRTLAAARALGLEVPQARMEDDTLVLADEPTVVAEPADAPAPPPPWTPSEHTAPSSHPTAPHPAPATPHPAPTAHPAPAGVDEPPSLPGIDMWPPPVPAVAAALAEQALEEKALARSPEDWPPPSPDGRPVQTPGNVVVPTGGPARVTTGVLAAAAAERARGEHRSVLEVKPTVLATEIDRLGDQLVVLQDRLELRDRHNGLRRSLALADVVDVEVQRRLTSAVLVVSTRIATDMVIKGLKPDAAEAARDAILRLRPLEPPMVPIVDERSLMRAIVELHRAGVLDDVELAEKTALVGRLAGRTQ